MELIPSRYNVVSAVNCGHQVIVNTLTKAVVQIPAGSYENLMSSAEHEEALHEMGILVSPDEEKAMLTRYLEQESDGRQLSLVWHVTRECNFRCSYCYQASHSSEERPMQNADLLRWLERKASNGCRELNLTVFGGEPLLEHDRIVALMKGLSGFGTQVHATLVTNGWLLTPPVVRSLAEAGISRFHVTIDGYRAEHDRRRPLADGSPTFERVLSNTVSALSEMTGTLRVNWDVQNIGSIEPLLRTISSNKVAASRLTLDLDHVFHDRMIHHVPEAEALHEQVGKQVSLAVQLGLAVKNPFTARMCFGRRPNALVIDSAGRVFGCNLLAEQPETTWGKIGDGVCISGEASCLVNTQCAYCQYYPLCGGGCLSIIERKIGSGCRIAEFDFLRRAVLPFVA